MILNVALFFKTYYLRHKSSSFRTDIIIYTERSRNPIVSIILFVDNFAFRNVFYGLEYFLEV